QQLRAQPSLVVVPATGAPARVAVAADAARAARRVEGVAARTDRSFRVLLVVAAVRGVLRDQRQADPLSAAVAARMDAGWGVVAATGRRAPAPGTAGVPRAAGRRGDRRIALAGGSSFRLPAAGACGGVRADRPDHRGFHVAHVGP